MGRAEDLFERLETEGVSAIDAFIEDRKAEELFLDSNALQTVVEGACTKRIVRTLPRQFRDSATLRVVS